MRTTSVAGGACKCLDVWCTSSGGGGGGAVCGGHTGARKVSPSRGSGLGCGMKEAGKAASGAMPGRASGRPLPAADAIAGSGAGQGMGPKSAASLGSCVPSRGALTNEAEELLRCTSDDDDARGALSLAVWCAPASKPSSPSTSCPASDMLDALDAVEV